MTSFKNMVGDYYSSYEYNDLRDETKADYQYLLRQVLDTRVEGESLRHVAVKNLTTKMCKTAYDIWCQRGIHFANKTMAVARVVYNHGLRMEMVSSNPFNSVRRRTPKSRNTLWEKDHVVQLLDFAYSDFNTRNLGLIAHMAYEWCQRVGDMRLLKWGNIDMEHKRVHILQSKRRAEVYLPMSDDLHEMLTQQHEDFGFQDYVAPRVKPRCNAYPPYSKIEISYLINDVLEEANLPKHLTAMDLRRTAVTEMMEGGVDLAGIMQVTGHKDIGSVKPYMVNTFSGASKALAARGNDDDEPS